MIWPCQAMVPADHACTQLERDLVDTLIALALAGYSKASDAWVWNLFPGAKR